MDNFAYLHQVPLISSDVLVEAMDTSQQRTSAENASDEYMPDYDEEDEFDDATDSEFDGSLSDYCSLCMRTTDDGRNHINELMITQRRTCQVPTDGTTVTKIPNIK